MHISKNSPVREEKNNSLDAPATEAPVQAKSMTPPPFSLDASSEGGGSEGMEMESGSQETKQLKSSAMADAGDGGGGGSAGGSGSGLPGGLKSSMEQMSGQDLSDVNVHMNSSKPKDVGALAYAQGTDIHVAPGQEKHLPHEAWHSVQQKQGRVSANTAVGGMAVNDNPGLEKEADDMGAKAMQMKADSSATGPLASSGASGGPIQKVDDPGVQSQTTTTGPQVVPSEQEQQNVEVTVPGTINIREGAAALFETVRGAVAKALGVTLDALSTQLFNVNLKFTFELGIEAKLLQGLFGVGFSPVFEASATLNMQDDRLIRAGWTISAGGKIATQWLWLIETESTFLASFGKTSVYRDLPHFAGRVYQKISELVEMIRKRTSQVDSLPSDKWDGEGRNWEEIRDTTPTDVHSTGTSQDHSIGVGGVLTESGDAPISASMGSSETDMHFYKGEGDERVVRNANQTTKSMGGKLAVAGLDAELSFTETNITNHANEDNDGRYHNYSLTINNPPKLKEFYDYLGVQMSDMASRITAIASGDFSSLFNGVKGLFEGALHGALNLITAEKLTEAATSTKSGAASAMTVELNFVESENQFALQYARLSVGKSYSASFSTTIPIASLYGMVDVSMTTGGSLSVGATGAALEIAGTNTMTYFITVYNGLVYTQAQVDKGLAPNRTSRWDAYKGKHFLELRGLIMNLGNPDSIAYKEAVNAHGLSPDSGLLAAAKESRTQSKLTDNARAELDSFFETNYQKRAQYAGAVAENAADHRSQTEAHDGRTPWSHVAGGSSTVFIDIANQAKPSVLRTDYSPATQTPSKPPTIMDSLLQDQKVNANVTIKYKEYHTVNEGSVFTPNRVPYTRKLSEDTFSFPKATDRSNALRILKGQFNDVWGNNPFKIPEEIFEMYLSGSGCTPILEEFVQGRYYNTFEGGKLGRSEKNRALGKIRTRFAKAADAGMTKMADDAISGAVIQEAGSDDTYETGRVFKDEHLTVNNRDGLSN